jgi:Ca2+/Na+ antiporter
MRTGWMDFIVLVACAAATVMAVRLLIIPGIGVLCARAGFSPKTRGQIIGYATSVPELAVVAASAVMGVFEAGFWNIASSNMVNLGVILPVGMIVWVLAS